MPDKPNKMILMGMDGIMYHHLKKFVDEGKMPNVSSLIQNGIFSEACPVPPCDTPTNWTTIVTGARTGTHGITGFRIHLPGESLDAGQRPEHRRRSFESTYCNAEYLWDAADKVGMRCLVINYPIGWPPNFQRGMMINGDGKPRKIAESMHYIPTYPAPLGEELLQNVNALGNVGSEIETKAERSRMGAELLGEAGDQLHEAVEQADRLCQIIGYLKNSHGWDLCFFHYHLIDSVNHSFLGYLSPQNPAYTKDKYTTAIGEYEAAYKVVDNFVGRLLKECVDDQTLTVLVSDHAALPCWKIVRIYQAFIRAGLLAYKWDQEKGKFVVDFSNTNAFPWIEPSYVWVNLKGRDPDGIVEPEDYELVREKSIQALRSLRDPDNGKCPISLALRKEEAYLLSQFGDRVGDVVYFIEPGYQLWDTRIEDEWSYEIFPSVFERCEVSPSIQVTGNHDQQLPLAKMGSLSNTSVLIMMGPGVKRNHKLTKPITLTDVAPTIAKLLGIPAPAQNEGQVICEALEP